MSARDKIKAVKAALTKNQSISRIARDLEVSRKTLYQWIKKYKLSPNRIKSNALELKYPRGIDHPLAKRFVLQKTVIKSIIKNPNISLDKLAKTLKEQGINISRTSLYRNLKDLDLNKRQLRELVLQYWQGPGRFIPSLKQEIIEKIVKREISITEAANLHNISRKSLYAWLNEYQTAISAGTAVIKELQDKYVKAESHPKSIYPKIQAGLVETVKQNPELSARQLSQLLNSSPATVWRVLDRYNLNKFEDRQIFASKYAPIITHEESKPLIDVVSIPSLDQLSPDVMPGPPPPKLSPVVVPTSSLLPTSASVRFKSFIIFTIIGFITGSAAYLSISTLISARSFSQLIGYLFANAALLLGMFFFAYSIRYYLVILYLLLFSRRLSQKLEQSKSDQKAGADQGQGLNPGLIPDLSHITLSRHPFVSIHLPLYNEKRVVNRLLEAVTSLDYDNYEVIVCDDSTDETKDIVNEWKNHPRIKLIHRDTRTGFKGGALKEALSLMHPQTEYVLVFDADFLPYPDTIEQFLKYFQTAAGTLDFEKVGKVDKVEKVDTPSSLTTFPTSSTSSTCRIAAIQGYQWHVLNKSENWITRGVRTEYAGSYVIERSAAEIYQGLKQIAGSVYLIRADLLRHYNWSSSLTEDFELTLRLYRDGYKVVYTPYIQAPSECVSTIKRLVRQRMRWAEGHSYNIRKYFKSLIFGRLVEVKDLETNLKSQIPNPKPQTISNDQIPNSKLVGHWDLSSEISKSKRLWIASQLSNAEKLEFLYLAPYYLQSAFFILGTFSWFISEAVFRVKLPFWTAVWGWSLVLTNMLSLPLMNLVGLFLEEAEEKDYSGIPAFVLLTYILAPFQAYAAIKGFLEKEEGPWFRTPKTGKITDIYRRSQFYRWITGFFGPQVVPVQLTTDHRYKTEINHRRHQRWGRVITALLLIVSLNVSYLTLGIPLTKPINPGNLALAAEPTGQPPASTQSNKTAIELTDYRHQADGGGQNLKKLNVKVVEGLADISKEKLIFNESDINGLINQDAGGEVTWLTQTGQPFVVREDTQGLDIFIKGEGSQITKYSLSKEWLQFSLSQANKSSAEFTEQINSKPIFQYQNGKYFWQDYTEGKIQTNVVQKEDYVVVLQQFPLYGPTASDLLVQAELEFKLGYVDNKPINKLTFKILPNQNHNRLIWQIEQKTDNKVELPGVLSAPLPEPVPSLGTVNKQYSAPSETSDITHDKPRFETDNLTVDWSDFHAESGSLIPEYPMSLVYPMCLSNLKPVTGIPWEHERAGNTDKIIFYPKGKAGELVIDPSISTTTTATSVTVSVANQFEVVFNASKGGVIDSWYDLENDSGKADQLADATDGLFDFYGTDGLTRRISDSTSTTQTMLENSGTRAVIQYTGNLGAINYNYVLTYTIYPTGDIYIKLLITNNTGSTITWTEQRVEITVDSATNHAADGDGVTTDGQAMTVGTNNWVKWVGDGTTEKDTAVLYHYSGFNYVEYYASGTKVALERDTSESQASAATTTRFFRLNLRPDTDSLGTTETEPDKYANDLLHPDDLTDGMSGAQGWFDTSEATSASVDSFNEAEGAYTVDAVSRSISWWNNQWGRRKPLTLVNNSGQDFEANTTVTVTVNTKTFYDTGELQSDCDDLRILYQPDSSTTTELSRYVSYPGSGSCSSSEASKVSFPLQAAIISGSNSTAYYLYYKNSSATAPANPDNAFDIGAKDALLVCPFDGTTTCAASETPSTETGAIRYSGSKSAMSFDGANDYINFPTSYTSLDNIPLGDFTVEWWQNRNNAPYSAVQNLFGTYDCSANGFWATGSGGTISFTVKNSTTNSVTTASSATSANQWVHVAIAYNSATKIGRIYIDGTEASYSTQTAGAGNYNGDSAAFRISSRECTTGYYRGLMDEFRISDVARYTGSFTPQTAPFVRDEHTKLLLHFDENGDDPRQTGKAIDDSGNGNHGTISGTKYVAGLVGVDNGTTDTGKADGDYTYSGHEGIFIEEATTNKITNPSFEHSTYNTNWTAGTGLTVQENSTSSFNKFGSKSTKLQGYVAGYGFDNANETYTGGALYQSSSRKRLGQGFQVSSGISVSSVVLPLYKTGSSFTTVSMRAEIQTDSSGVPSGTAVTNGASDVVLVSSVTTSYSDITFNFSTPPSISSSTQYHIVLIAYTDSGGTVEQTLVDSDSYVIWIQDYTSPTYTNGTSASMNESSVWTASSGTDYIFSVTDSNSKTLTASINAGNTNTHTLSAYVYNMSNTMGGTFIFYGTTVSSSIASLVFNGVTQTTTYTDMGGGWWRLTYSAAAGSGAQDYGIVVQPGKVIYVDGVQLEEKAYATTYTDGTLGSGYSWSGTAHESTSSRTVEIVRFADTISSSQGAISVWFKPHEWVGSSGNYQFIIGASGNQNYGGIAWDQSFFRFYNNAGNANDQYTISPVVGRWYNLVAVWSGTTATLYVNAASDGSNNSYNSVDWTPTSIDIGRRFNTDSAYANGIISDTRVFNDALTSTEVADLYYSGLLSHQTGDELTGSEPLQVTVDMDGGTYNRINPNLKIRNWRDTRLPSSVMLENTNLNNANSYNASLKPFTTAYFAQDLTWASTLESSGAVTTPDIGSAGSVTNATFTTGKYGNGLLSDATGEYASLPMSGNVSATTGTVEFWYKSNGTVVNYEAFFGSDEGDNQFQLQRGTANTIITFAVNNSTYSTWNPTTINVFDGTWHHIRLTYDTTNNSSYLYLDGTSQGQNTTNHVDIDISTYNLRIGNSGVASTGNPSQGIIDEFRVYNTVAGPLPIAKGGDTANADEFLGDPATDYTFDFNDDDASNRGEYVFLGSDSKFTGINYQLTTKGTGSSADFDWEYWNGTAWSALTTSNEITSASSFETTNGTFYFSEPTTWSSYSVNGSTNLYYIRGHLEGGTLSDFTESVFYTDILLFQYLNTITGNDQTFIITSSPLRQSQASIQIDVPNRYRAIMNTGDTTDYIVFYDRAQNDASPNATHEFKGPCILETNTYCLRDDANRITTILESTATRVRVRVEGKFNNEAGTDYLDDESATPLLLTVSEDYTFTTEGLSVYNTTDFRSTGVTLDAASGHNGYEWLGVYADVTDGAFDDTGNVTYGTGETEGTTSTDGVAVANSNLYFFLPGTGSSTYQDAFIGIQRAGWYDDTTGGTHQWYWDEAESGTQDLLTAQEQNHLTNSLHSSKWYFLMLPEASLDTEAERESYFNDNANPDILTYTTGSEWNDAPGSPGLNFDGVDDYVNIGDSTALRLTSAGTLTAWVKFDSAPDGYEYLVGKDNGGTASAVSYYMNKAGPSYGYFRVGITDGSSNIEAQTSTTSWQTGVWYHFAGRWDGSNLQMFVNGTTDGNPTSQTINAQQNATHNVKIGCGYASPCYDTAEVDGVIDDVRIYNTGLSASQIQQVMNGDTSVATSNLVAHWKFNENTGQTVHDESTNNHDGTLGASSASAADDPTWTTGFVPDHYNEAEGTYTVSAASDQLSVDIDGGDNVSTLLNGAVTAGATSITIDSTTGFPDGGGTTTYVAYIEADKFSYTDATATTFTGIPATGELSVIGHADNTVVSLMNRHKPFYKVRGYRLNTEPNSVTLEGITLTDGTDYNLDVKPVSDAYFAQDATWYSSLESSGAVTSPDIGSAGTVNGADFTTGRYGNGARFNADDESVSFAISSNFDKAHGTFEFWYQPNYASSSTSTTRAIAGDVVNASNQFTLAYGGTDQGGNGELSFYINENGSARSVYFLNSEFTWNTGDWVHIRAVWDDTLSSSDLKLYLNGVATSNRLNDGLYNSANLTLGSNFYVGNDDAAPAASEANGVIDEFRMYDFSAGGGTPTDLAEGGDTADADEYLNDTANDKSLSFAVKDASERGEYLYLGSDSRVSGFNIDLDTLGVSGGTLNLDWEYWDGDSWASLESITGFTDSTSNLTADGAVYWSADPINWRSYSVNGSTDLYYIRASLNQSSGVYSTSPIENTVRTDILVLQYLANISSIDQTLVIVPEFIWNLLPLIIGSTLIMKKRHLNYKKKIFHH